MHRPFRLPSGAAAVIAAGLVLSSCASEPFSYSDDRCLGSYNQCRNDCAQARSAAVEDACFKRCLTTQQQCYATGDEAAGSTIAQDELIGRARTQREKEAAFRRYKARKQREREKAAEEGRDPYADSTIIEILPDDPAKEDVEADGELRDQ